MKAVSTIVVAALFALSLSPPASATAAPTEPGATLHLSWSAPGVSNQVFALTITCFPTGTSDETYYDADTACAELTRAAGDLEVLPGRPSLGCGNYRGWAIRTTATGQWFGQPVTYDELHANLCEARKATGLVFAF